MAKHVRVETKHDLTSDAKATLQAALARTAHGVLPNDILTYGMYKFFTVYDAAQLATTQKVLKNSMVLLAKNGRLEMDGRSRDTVPHQWTEFVQSLTRDGFDKECKHLVLRVADKYIRTATGPSRVPFANFATLLRHCHSCATLTCTRCACFRPCPR